jgi:hypothetical protein
LILWRHTCFLIHFSFGLNQIVHLSVPSEKHEPAWQKISECLAQTIGARSLGWDQVPSAAAKSEEDGSGQRIG